ncbi:MAG: prepilin-type N-terminal cleavage/methylation domain-containing protein [bacterium]
MKFQGIKNINSKGLTLTEILVVIAILTSLMLISIPFFRNFKPTLQLGGVAREIITDLRYIQQFTITEQVEYCLKFFETEKKYQIIKCEGEVVLKEKFLPEEIKIITVDGFTNNIVRYNPYGAAAEEGTIILENTNNAIKTIEVKVSGFVKITD